MPFPVDIQYIKNTEEKLGVIFPASFKLRMLKLNGGEVRTNVGGWEDYWQLNPFFDTSDKTRLKRPATTLFVKRNPQTTGPIFHPTQ